MQPVLARYTSHHSYVQEGSFRYRLWPRLNGTLLTLLVRIVCVAAAPTHVIARYGECILQRAELIAALTPLASSVGKMAAEEARKMHGYSDMRFSEAANNSEGAQFKPFPLFACTYAFPCPPHSLRAMCPQSCGGLTALILAFSFAPVSSPNKPFSRKYAVAFVFSGIPNVCSNMQCEAFSLYGKLALPFFANLQGP